MKRKHKSLDEVLKWTEKEFNNVLNVTLDAMNLISRANIPNQYRFLHRTLSFISSEEDSSFSLEKEDVRQQLNMIWIDCYNSYYLKPKKPNIGFKKYVQRVSTWRLRDWVKKKVHKETVEFTEESFPVLQAEPIPFKIDLAFVAKGNEGALFEELSLEERYVLYLKYNLDKSIVEIGKILQKDRLTVSTHLDLVLDKLRRKLTNENRKPRRAS